MKIFSILLIILTLISCNQITDNNEFMSYSTFENNDIQMSFHAGNFSMLCDIVDNPQKDGINSSDKCVRVVSGGGENEFVWSDPFGGTFDFTKNKPIFKIKIFAPYPDARIWMKLEPSNFNCGVEAVEVKNVKNKKANQWEELTFDFTSLSPRSNRYRKIVLMFDAGHSTFDQVWYFDDIVGPSNDLTSISLFKRSPNNPIFRPEKNVSWRDAHIANASILNPKSSPDGNWWMYVRGSGHTPDYHDQIGLFTQAADEFNPEGKWVEYDKNPVIKHGKQGSFDEWHLLDCAAVKGGDNKIYVYYKGRRKNDNGSMDPTSSIGVAYSTDGGYTFIKKDTPWKENGGPSDAVYHNGKYYIFCGTKVYVTDDPLSYEKSIMYNILTLGDGPSEFDNAAIHGSMVFRLEGIDKWFLAYQGMSVRNDFPNRFHIAYSDNLINWTKVDNTQPLFTRGKPGEWDQGGIWYPEIIEHKDSLYLYYEGWGREGHVVDRNSPYFNGNSSIGVAVASKKDFLDWCKLN